MEVSVLVERLSSNGYRATSVGLDAASEAPTREAALAGLNRLLLRQIRRRRISPSGDSLGSREPSLEASGWSLAGIRIWTRLSGTCAITGARWTSRETAREPLCSSIPTTSRCCNVLIPWWSHASWPRHRTNWRCR